MFEFFLQVAQYDNIWVNNIYKHHETKTLWNVLSASDIKSS